MSAVSKLLSSNGYITVNKHLIKLLGLHEAVLLGELCSEFDYWESEGKLVEGSFYATRNNIEENTGLSEHLQRKALDTLISHGIVSVVKRGIPATNYYTIDFDAILQLLNTLTTSCLNFKQLDVENMNLNNNKNKNKEEENKSNTKVLDLDEKPKKKNLYEKCIDAINDFTDDEEVRERLTVYLKMRLEIKDKQLYANQWIGMLNKLREYTESKAEVLAIIQQSIDRGYLSFYELKKSQYNRQFNKTDCEINVKCDTMTEDDINKQNEFLKRMKEEGKKVEF